MLKGIPKILSPELVKILMEMGHGDEIIVADGNFPAATYAKRLVRADGHSATEIFEAILQLFPLDTYAMPLYLMEKVTGDTIETPIWDDFRNIAGKNNPQAEIGFIERYEFYERAKNAFAIIATSEKAQYGNIILKKGIV